MTWRGTEGTYTITTKTACQILYMCDLDAKLIFHPYTSRKINNLADVGL